MALSTLNLTLEWDKTFPKSELVNHSKVTFHNRYGIELAADMYVPKNTEGRFPAIAVSGPFGAVKEQQQGADDHSRRFPRGPLRRPGRRDPL